MDTLHRDTKQVSQKEENKCAIVTARLHRTRFECCLLSGDHNSFRCNQKMLVQLFAT